MKRVIFILSSLLLTHHVYADECMTKYPIQNYDIGTIVINSLPFNYELPNSISQPLVGDCAQIKDDKDNNPFIRVDFIPNSSGLSASSPFQVLRKEDIELETYSSSSSAHIEKAKEYILRSLRLSFSLQDNSNDGTELDILNSSMTYNIVPTTVPIPSNIQNYNGLVFYTGGGDLGINSLGIKIASLTVSFSAEQPTSNIINVLNNSTARIRIGEFLTQYYYSLNSSAPILQLNSSAYVQMSFSLQPPTCSVEVPSSLYLGSTTTELIQNGAQNKKDFNIDIKCTAVMDDNAFKLKILDANSISNTNANGLLMNSADELTKSSASIQLINNITNQPFKIGEFFDYFSTQESSSQFKKVASAQLFNSSGQVKSGQVEGRATFFVEYN